MEQSSPSTEAMSGPSTEAMSGPSTEAMSGPSTEAMSGPSTEPLLGPSTEAMSGPSTEAMLGPRAQENICSQHDRPRKLFCRTDQQLLCSLCLQQHQGHDTVSSAAERTQRQKQLELKRNLQLQDLQDKELEQERLRLEAQHLRRSAHTAVQRSGDSFREMVLLLERKCSEVEQQIRSEEQVQLKQVQELQDQLQRDVTELKRSISELETLSLTPDHGRFLLLCPSLSTDSEETESRLRTGPRRGLEAANRAVSALRNKLQLALTEFTMFDHPLSLRAPQRSEPQLCPTKSKEEPKREDFLEYARDITLDPNTANRHVSLSDGNRRAEFVSEEQSYPDHPDRFDDDPQVLSTAGLTGRCYWEVEISGRYMVHVAAAYSKIKKQGTLCDSGFGRNNKSWVLVCHKNCYSYTFGFKNYGTEVSGPASRRIGVYLDHSAGVLSFYSVQDRTMILLHKVQTAFSQPLFAGFGIYRSGDFVYLPKLK